MTTLLAGCATVHYDYRVEPDPRHGEYVLGALDQLAIVVWKNKDLSAEVTIRPDGMITLPLIGDVRAAGKTPTNLKKELATRYGEFVHADDTVITVTVTGVNSYRFTITGNVEHPGVVNVKYYVTAVEALALAGGPNRFAANIFYVVRSNDSGAVRRVPIDYRRIVSGSHPEENIVILANDMIVVP